MDLEQEIFQDQPDVPDEFLQLSVEDIKTRTRLLDNEIRVLKDESTRLSLEQSGLKERIKDNAEKVHHCACHMSLTHAHSARDRWSSERSILCRSS